MKYSHVLLRPGVLRRGALCLAVLLLSAPLLYAEDTPLPEGTGAQVGLPPYVPCTDERVGKALRTPAEFAAWCAECAALGRRHAGTRRGGDLLFSAADAARRRLRDPKQASSLYAEAASAYAGGDITLGVLYTHWLTLEVDRGNVPEATRILTLLAEIEDWREPRDLSDTELARWTTWQAERRLRLPPLRARHLAARGELREAAAILERLVEDEADALEAWRRLRYLERAARDYYRAGRRTDAVRAIDAAIELADDERKQASLRFWRLYAKHGLLNEDALPLIGAAWPGEEFESDLRAYLRSIQGLDGVGTRYLSLASRAFAAERYDVALEIYLLGLRDPGLIAEARRNSSIWRGLLMGYSAAMKLEKFDEAEQILEIVERIADEPMEDKDAFLLALQKERRWVAERPLREAARKKLAEAKKKRAKREAERRHPARMETGAAPEAETEADSGSGANETTDGADLPVLLLLGILIALGAAAVLVLGLLRRTPPVG